MYTQKLVVSIKSSGKVLREFGDSVVLPFGAEYSVLVKNLDSVCVKFSLSIDGQDVAEGTKIVVEPNSHVDLERFIHNGNWNSGNRFRFIERTAKVEAHRGIGPDDGLIRVEAWRQHRQIPSPPPTAPRYPTPLQPRFRPMGRPHHPRAGAGRSASMGRQTPSPRPDMTARGAPRPGITVRGSESTQQFHPARDFLVEPQSIVVVLRLRGSVDGRPVDEPLSVDFKPQCETCGHACAPVSAFCERCGTAVGVI